MSKNELISVIDISKPTKSNQKNIFKSKIGQIEECLKKPSKRNNFKSKIEELKEIIHDPIIDRDKKIEEIKKIIYDPRNNLFKKENYICKPVRIGSYYFEYKSNENKDKTLSPKDYLDEIKPYLFNMINDHKTQGEWKIKLTMAINFYSSKDSEKTRTMYRPSDKTEVTIGTETDKIIRDLFDFFLKRYQKGLEESIRGTELVWTMWVHCIINFII